jgi:hypothetical protein
LKFDELPGSAAEIRGSVPAARITGKRQQQRTPTIVNALCRADDEANTFAYKSTEVFAFLHVAFFGAIAPDH